MTTFSGYALRPLRQDREHVLHRGHGPDSGLPVFILAPASQKQTRQSVARLQHEYALRALLPTGWCTKPVALLQDGSRTALVLEDPGGEPLDLALVPPLEIAHFLRIAIACSESLGQIHARGLVHGDVRPANFLVDGGGKISLMGFGMAFQLRRDLLGAVAVPAPGQNLEYMSPEQTGRVNRSVDGRSDLYSLGVVLYQLLVGALPFGASDAIEWMHSHIARRAVPPRERRSDVPEPVDAIICKLLAKSPDERYQTAGGVEHDLRACLSAWETTGRVEPFTLAARDFSGQLQFSEQLYGREAESQTLEAMFARVRAKGSCEAVFLSGAAGAGKSSLVNRLLGTLTSLGGRFAIGKFEQHASTIPHAPVAQALQQLVRPILALGDVELGAWQARLREALGLNGQLIVNLVPELALIVGEQAPVQDIRPRETLNRFYLALRRLLGVFARPDRPLVLFMDDLQWADAATLALLERLVVERDVPHMLLVCAYRPSEVGPFHPMRRLLASTERADRPIEKLQLGLLSRVDVQRLLADALRHGSGEVMSLADLVFEKTGGHPLFTHQFLLTLVDEGLLTFDRSASSWRWDAASIDAKHTTANVVDLIVEKLDRLSPDAREALKHLACLGMSGTSSTVGVLTGLSNKAVESALCEAIEGQLVLIANDGYRFKHDRVREAAYAMIPAGERAAWHLQTGRVLAAAAGPAPELQIFEIVNQYNRGSALIDSEAEAERLASLNLIAGKRARDATGYLESKAYFDAGVQLLPQDRWTRHFRLTFDLELGLAECEYLTGDLSSAGSHLSGLLTRAVDLADRALLTSRLVAVNVMSGDFNRALEAGLAYLREVGIHWSARPSDGEVDLELHHMWCRIGERPIEALIDLPPMTNPHWRATMDVLLRLMPAGVFLNQNFHSLLVVRAVSLSVEHGNSDASCLAYICMPQIARVRLTDRQMVVRFGNLGLELARKHGPTRNLATVYHLYGASVGTWIRPLHTCRTHVQAGLEMSEETGNISTHMAAISLMLDLRLAAGDALGDLHQAVTDAHATFKRANYAVGMVDVLSEDSLIRWLCGLAPGTEIDKRFFERTSFEGYSPAYKFWSRKLEANFYAGDYAAAVDAAARAEPANWINDAFIAGADYHFFAALSHAAACRTATPEQRGAHLETTRREHRGIAACAELCPENFGDRAALVAAEIAALEGREFDAERLYELAIRSARDQKFIHHEALAHELAAGFYASRGLQSIADACARSALSCYAAWGADGKVAQLEEALPHLRLRPARWLPDPAAPQSVEHLDLATVAKLSQATTSEIELPKLIDVVMKLAIEHAGADRGVLLLIDGDKTRVEAEARVTGSEISVRLVDSELPAAELPESMLRYVARTGESLLIADASEPNLFSEDPYFRAFAGRSILCLPMIKQAKLVGQLYLENRLISDVFTQERLVVLKLLAAQAAISIENARLYANLRRAEASLVRAQQAERDRIARELHDTLLQSTQGLVWLFAKVAKSLVDGDPTRRQLEEALDRAQMVMDEGRDRVAHLRAMGDEALDLAQAVEAAAESLAAGSAVACRTLVEGIERTLESAVSDQAQRIGREALVNALRHSGAKTIQIDIIYAAEELRLRVRDDGVGFDAQTPEANSRTGHWGLIGMRERASQIGARLDIRSAPGLGTEIELSVPAQIAYSG